MSKPRILVVEDDAVARQNLEHILHKGDEYLIDAAVSGVQALELLERETYDLVLTDLRMEKVDGMAVLVKAKERHPDAEVIMLTAYASVDSAIEAMKRGAFHYLAKPYKIDEVRAHVAHALERTELKRELAELRRELKNRGGLDFIVGKSRAIEELVRTVRMIAPTEAGVLIQGETGTGKELFARAVHELSPRADRRFLALNCGAFTEELLSSELFGHEKGAFTGAAAAKPGLFEAAQGGTLFLDEIGDMPLAMQVKLLRVLQERVVTRVGGTQEIPVDVRIVAATHHDLKELSALGRFRSDLFYRLNVVVLNVPPLREHPDDIPLLAQHFTQIYAERLGKPAPTLSPEFLAELSEYRFPGNIRELENLVERAMTLSNGEVLTPRDLPREIREAPAGAEGADGGPGGLPTLEDKERQYVAEVLAHTGGNRTKAAEILGIDRVSLWRKLKKYGLES